MTNSFDLRSYHTESCSHTHDFAQLVLPVYGSMELEAGHYLGVVDEDVGIYIAPNEKHCFAGSEKNLFLVIDITSHCSDKCSSSNIINLDTTTKQLIHFTTHYLTHNKRDFCSDASINQLLLHFAASAFSAEPDVIVLKAKQWIEANFSSSVDISKVAQHCYLSVSQLQRRFKQATGSSLAEYWRMTKLQRAKQLLSHKNCYIEAIAFEVGYENLSAFSRSFSKRFGESPCQWKLRR